MKLIRLVKIMVLAVVCAVTILSCSGQGKIDAKGKKMKPTSVGKTVGELALNTHLFYQDKNNNYWFVNKEGTYKYDGKTLVLFSQKDGLASNRILAIQEDEHGNIYFDTPQGVSKFDGQQFETLKVMEGESGKSKWESTQDDLWFRVGWDKKGPYRFDGENLYHLEFPKNKMEDDHYAKYPNISYNPYSIYSMYKDRKGNVWFGTADLGVYQFDGSQIRWMHEEHLGTTPEGGAFGIRSIIEDKDGYLWISNTNYKYEILPDSKDEDSQLKSLNYKKEKGLVDKNEEILYLMSMLEDDKGNLWLVNLDGVWIKNGPELTPFFIKDGARNISPSSVYKDNHGDLWLGTENNGMYKYDGVIVEKAIFNQGRSNN